MREARNDPPRAGRGRRKQGETSGKLLTMAAKEFRRNGFHATTTRELSAALGIEKASLYYHVSSKQELLYRICVQSLDAIYATVSTAIEDIDEHRSRIAALIHAHVDVMLRDRDMHATMLVELRALQGGQRTEVIALRDRYEGLVRSELADAQAAGVLTGDHTARDLSLSLLNLLNWTIFWYRPGGGSTPEQIASMFETVFLDGVALVR
jgi:AcrR family transcriptional regulator